MINSKGLSHQSCWLLHYSQACSNMCHILAAYHQDQLQGLVSNIMDLASLLKLAPQSLVVQQQGRSFQMVVCSVILRFGLPEFDAQLSVAG